MCTERKGRTLHLLKQSAKPVQNQRQRKRHEVLMPGQQPQPAPEEAKGEGSGEAGGGA